MLVAMEGLINNPLSHQRVGWYWESLRVCIFKKAEANIERVICQGDGVEDNLCWEK